MLKTSILNLLSRRDKWYLGGGNRLLWSPQFPMWLDSTGFWDEVSYYNYTIAPCFTVTFLDEVGRELFMKCKSRKWNPAALERQYVTERNYLKIKEQSACLPEDVLISEFTIENQTESRKIIHLILWTVQKNVEVHGEKSISNVQVSEDGISFDTLLTSNVHQKLRVQCRLALSRKADSFSVQLTEGTAIQPHWMITPFYDMWDGRLNNEINLTGITDEGLIFVGLHTKITLSPDVSESITAGFTAIPSNWSTSKTLPSLSVMSKGSRRSVKNWENYFSDIPYFECSDKYFTHYYWYRWYGLKLMTLSGGEGHYSHPAVCEGIGYFRAPISYSAQCHMRETRWMVRPDVARGCLLNFIANQYDDGRFPGYLDPYGIRKEMFYHANWGSSVFAVHHIHPDKKFLETAYNSFSKYADYFDRERDSEGRGLYDIQNHYETGQEFMSRYTAVFPDADSENWGRRFRLKGVDVTVYLYELKKALSYMATLLEKPNSERVKWQLECQKIKKAILSEMWDPDEQMFFDIDPQTGNRTNVKAATCFYPYMTDIVDESHIAGLRAHLLSPDEFWTPFPIPTTSIDDPTFSAEPFWKGKRMNCPWNGRVWPMTNSHIAEALAETAIHFDPEFRPIVVEFIQRFIRMMFFNGDPKRPNCFEHYHPFSGRASLYRGVDDYQHSWVVDLLLKYVAGIRPREESIVIDPFPFNLEWLRVSNLIIQGHHLELKLDGESFEVTLDKGPGRRSVLGKPLIIAL